MGFSEDALEDIDDVFFDEDFFGSRHNFDGRDILVIVDDEEAEELKKDWIKKDWKDEVNKASVLLFVREKDMERKLTVNSTVEFDGKTFYVNGIWKPDGVWKLLLGRNQV